MKLKLLTLAAGGILGLSALGVAGATPSPNGPGQPGAPNLTCGSSPDTALTPGNTMNARGAPFNPDGISGMHYAGNPGTNSLLHSNSTRAVAQYDIACFQHTIHHQ
jgi:hypothetical protein